MRLLFLPALITALVLAGDTSRASTPRRLHVGAGISVVLPGGWRILAGSLTSCSDPKERLAAATFPAPRLGPTNAIPRNGALVLVLEDDFNDPRGFSPRPAQFWLSGRPTTFEGCCDTPSAPGYELTFRDHGRDFIAFAWAPRKLRVQAVWILDSLRVEATRKT